MGQIWLVVLVVLLSGIVPAQDRAWSFERIFPNARGPLRVKGPPSGGAYVLADVRGKTIVEGSTPDGEYAGVPLPVGGLVPGVIYYLISADADRSTGRLPYVVLNSRWGDRMKMGPTQHAMRLSQVFPTRGIRVGTSPRLQGLLSWTGEQEPGSAVDVYLWVGIYEDEGSVTMGANGVAYITEVLGGVGPIEVRRASSRTCGFAIELPIPDDPRLEGVHLLVQFSLLTGGEALISDVAGSLIFPRREWLPGVDNVLLDGVAEFDERTQLRRRQAVANWLQKSAPTSLSPQKKAVLSNVRKTGRGEEVGQLCVGFAGWLTAPPDSPSRLTESTNTRYDVLVSYVLWCLIWRLPRPRFPGNLRTTIGQPTARSHYGHYATFNGSRERGLRSWVAEPLGWP